MWLSLCALCPIISVLPLTTARSAYLHDPIAWQNPSSLLDTQYSPVRAQMPKELFSTGYVSSLCRWHDLVTESYAGFSHWGILINTTVFSQLWQLRHYWVRRKCTKRNSLQLHSPGISSPGVRLTLEKTDFPFNSGYQLQLASRLGAGLCAHFLFAVLGFCLVWTVQALCVLVSLCECLCPLPWRVWKIVWPSNYRSKSVIFPRPLGATVLTVSLTLTKGP